MKKISMLLALSALIGFLYLIKCHGNSAMVLIIMTMITGIVWTTANCHESDVRRPYLAPLIATNISLWILGGIWVQGPFSTSENRQVFLVNGKIIPFDKTVFVVPFFDKVQTFYANYSVEGMDVSGTTKDSIEITGKLSVELRHTDDPTKVRHYYDVSSEVAHTLRARFAEAIGKLNSNEIQLSGLGLEISIGQSQIPLPDAVKMNGQIKVRQIWPAFREPT